MSVVILLYSKYSSNCDKLQYKLNSFVEYQKLCVDNQQVRDRIKLNQSNVGLIVVPTLFIFYQNGDSDKLEGKQCFEWVEFLEKQALENKKKEANEQTSTTQKNLIPIEDVSFDETERKLDSSPLIKKELPSDVEEKNKEIKEIQAESSMQKNNSGESIMNLAQQMQKERGLDEKKEI